MVYRASSKDIVGATYGKLERALWEIERPRVLCEDQNGGLG